MDLSGDGIKEASKQF